jgi:hypothetical protein
MVKLHRHRTKIEFERWDWNKTTPIEFRPQPIHRPHSAEAGLLRPRETVSASIESQTSAQNTSAEGNESPTRSKGHRLVSYKYPSWSVYDSPLASASSRRTPHPFRHAATFPIARRFRLSTVSPTTQNGLSGRSPWKEKKKKSLTFDTIFRLQNRMIVANMYLARTI